MVRALILLIEKIAIPCYGYLRFKVFRQYFSHNPKKILLFFVPLCSFVSLRLKSPPYFFAPSRKLYCAVNSR
jgi:hypothetical protein